MDIRSYLFIVNPVAGKNKGKKAIQIIEEAMKNRGLVYEIKETSRIGEAQDIAREASMGDYDVIVAVGGDGTINEVVNGMVGSNKLLSVIPAGTGNDLARSLNLPSEQRRALEVIMTGKVTEIDLGRINGKYFINFASIGLDALIAEEANKIKAVISGTYAYILGVLKGLWTFRSTEIELIVDGRKQIHEIMLVAICNGSYYGGGMKIAPSASIMDGYFDICIVKKMPKLKLLFLFPTIFKGKHVKYKEVEFFRGKKVEVITKTMLKINADGEVIKHKPIEFQVAEEKLKIISI